MKKNTLIIVIVLAILALGAWYYFSQHPATQVPNENESPVTDDTSALPAGGMETGEIPSDTSAGVKEFTIASDHFSFIPNAITVKKGDHVKITFANSVGTHDLKIDEFNVGTPLLGSGEKATIEFVADKTGSFQYYCSVGNHRAMGMWGTLTVSE